MKQIMYTLKRLYRFMRPFRFKLVLSIVLAIIGSGLNVLLPLLISQVIDYVTTHVSYAGNRITSSIDFSIIMGHLLRIVTIVLAGQIATYFSNRFIATVIQNSMQTMRTHITEKLNHLPTVYFDHNQQGNILSRVTNDIENIGNALQQGFLTLITSFFTLILVIIVLTTISWQVMLLTFTIVPASLIISNLIVKRSQSSFDKLQKSLGELNGFIQEDYSGFEIIKLYGQEEVSEQKFVELVANVSESGFRGNFLSSLINPLSGVVTYLVYLIIAVYGGYLTLQGVISIGLLQACTQYVWQTSTPVSQIIELVPGIQMIFAASERVFEVLDEPEEAEDNATKHLPVHVKGEVEFRRVDFSYTEDKPLITDLSFKINSGQMVAIVGPTGAGKTTLVNLLMRFYDVNAGAILIDGVPTMDVSRSEVRSQFGMVLQDTWLYKTSIKENIRFGKLDATDDEVIEAAKIANVHDFILSLSDGYDTILNEETSNISQGQKQLLTIARAILANPRILILDEATSSVDTRIELLIQNAMHKVMQGRTSFVIAHRLSTVKNADLILVIKEGSIIEQGTHTELLKQKGFYEALYSSQFSE